MTRFFKTAIQDAFSVLFMLSLAFKTTILDSLFHLKDKHPKILKLKIHYSYIKYTNDLTQKISLKRADGFFITYETL